MECHTVKEQTTPTKVTQPDGTAYKNKQQHLHANLHTTNICPAHVAFNSTSDNQHFDNQTSNIPSSHNKMPQHKIARLFATKILWFLLGGMVWV